jgi:peroxiredoxin
MTSEVESATILLLGQTVPGFALADSEGNRVHLKSFRQRRPVLIAFLHCATCPDCRAWLSALVETRDELAYRDVQPLLIFPEDAMALRALQVELELPGALLSDPEGDALSRFLRIEETATRLPVLLVAVGRYNDCLDAWIADEPSQWPPIAEPMAAFAFAEQEDCACGLPIWPED